jgi:predicted helicase
VYEKFFQGFAVKVADTHGIVYTPQPIVDFMVKSVESALQRDFNKSLAHEGVHILDPFVGTGNFILRVIREIHAQNPAALRNKYLNELHCNEVMLLPYYIACLNIEHLYFELTGEYLPFPGICLVDTFELVEDRQMGMFTSDNTDRVQRQKDAPIYVVIGNPPYNAGQVNENDNNKNRKYPAIDKRVEETYSKDSTATLRNALADPYVKAFRMASDRVLQRGEGIVCYVTNNGFLDGIAFDGMRKHLRRDFDTIWLYDLRGNARTSGELRRKEKGNVFNDAIRVGVAITMMERQRAHEGSGASLQLQRLGDYLESWQKQQAVIESVDFSQMSMTSIDPADNEGWLGIEMADDWDEMVPMGSKEGKSGLGEGTIFKLYSNGVKTNSDAYTYNFQSEKSKHQYRAMVDDYRRQQAAWYASGKPGEIDSYIQLDESRLKWIRNTKRSAARGNKPIDSVEALRLSLYRPFTVLSYCFDPIFNEDTYRFPRIFPLPETENVVVCLSAIGQSKPFHTLAVDVIPDLHLTGDSQCFPLYTYDEDGTNRKDNITDWGLEQFQSHYKDTSITKLDIFHYVYGILHDPGYRTKYAANLKRELPRIPFAENFWKVAETGKRLMDIHVHYEDQPEFALHEEWSLPKGYVHPYGLEVTSVDQVPERDRYRVTKMKRDKKDPTRLIVNDFLTLTGIPENVDEYKLGNRSALDWIIDQYQVSTDKRSGITNDPNREDDPTYIIRLIKKVVTVSVETVGLVEGIA